MIILNCQYSLELSRALVPLMLCLSLSSLSPAKGESRQASTAAAETVDYKESLSALLVQHPVSLPRSSEFYKILEHWAMDDFQAAERWVIKTGFERNLSDGYKYLCTVLIKTNPDEVGAWASSIKDSQGRRVAWFEIYGRMWGEKPLEERLRLVLDVPDSSVRQKLLWRVFRSWAQRDYETAVEVASTLENPGDLEAAMQMLPTRHPNRKEIRHALSEAKERAEDFDSVTTWLASLQDVDARAAAEMSVATLWLKKAPRKVAAWASKTGNHQLLKMAYGAWVKDDKTTAITSAKQITDISTRSQALAGIVASRALTYEDAAQVVLVIDDQIAKEDAIKALAGSWGRTLPVKAMAWARTLAPGDLRNMACMTIVRRQLSTNPRYAAELAESIDDPPTQAAATWMVAGGWAKKQPHDAMLWAKGIADPNAKSRALLRIAKYCTLYRGPKRGAELANNIEDRQTRMDALKIIYSKWQDNGYQKEGDAWFKTFTDEDTQTQIKATDGFSQAIERFDENGDGKVDQAEVRKAATAILERMESKGLTGSWTTFDTNKNGILEAEERDALLKDLIARLSRNKD